MYTALYLVIEHIRFSRRPLCLEQIRIFQEGNAPSNRHFFNVSVAAFEKCYFPNF